MNQADYPSSAPIRALEADLEELGPVNDGENWYVTEAWATRFRSHLQTLLPLAADGDVRAQYHVASLYMIGYLHASESEACAHYPEDAKIMTEWLEKAARAGHFGAMENLMDVGTSDEADRLKRLYKENRALFGNGPAPSKGWEKSMAALHKLAYGTDG